MEILSGSVGTHCQQHVELASYLIYLYRDHVETNKSQKWPRPQWQRRVHSTRSLAEPLNFLWKIKLKRFCFGHIRWTNHSCAFNKFRKQPLQVNYSHQLHAYLHTFFTNQISTWNLYVDYFSLKKSSRSNSETRFFSLWGTNLEQIMALSFNTLFQNQKRRVKNHWQIQSKLAKLSTDHRKYAISLSAGILATIVRRMSMYT